MTNDPNDSDLEQGDDRPRRKKWPKDRDKRITAMAKAMPEFITAYFGNETAIAAAMSVSPIDVAEAIKWSPSLIEQQEIAVNSIEALLLNQAISVALTSKNVTGCRWLLETMYPERYGKAKAAGPKGKGFTAPTDDPESLKSVLDKED